MTENDIMLRIWYVYGDLSPENLCCDGELPRHLVRKKYNRLMRELNVLFNKLGRVVSETESYKWWKENREKVDKKFYPVG